MQAWSTMARNNAAPVGTIIKVSDRLKIKKVAADLWNMMEKKGG
jgi:hypothetical protein